ncbi:hypothetical protein TNCV_2940951 [Trichonephila clavipes]|nr:hypothetical protein TNCV_2940951 [Trichonephila clavipes]
MATIPPSLVTACHADSLLQITPDLVKYIRRIQENDARGKIWGTLLCSPVPMGLPRWDLSAVFKTLIEIMTFLCNSYTKLVLKTLLHSVSWGRGYEFCSPDSLCFLGQQRGFNFSSDNFTVRAGLYRAVCKKMAFTAYSLM